MQPSLQAGLKDAGRPICIPKISSLSFVGHYSLQQLLSQWWEERNSCKSFLLAFIELGLIIFFYPGLSGSSTKMIHYSRERTWRSSDVGIEVAESVQTRKLIPGRGHWTHWPRCRRPSIPWNRLCTNHLRVRLRVLLAEHSRGYRG